jgi:mRNA-degrading endonuclease RelE of RelBE toxin-antitoxin system
MKRRLIIRTDVLELIRHSPPLLKRRLRQALDNISENPKEGKALQEEFEDLWSFKVARFRIIYRFDKSSVTIISVGPRKTVYEELALEIGQMKRGDKKDI